MSARPVGQRRDAAVALIHDAISPPSGIGGAMRWPPPFGGAHALISAGEHWERRFAGPCKGQRVVVRIDVSHGFDEQPEGRFWSAAGGGSSKWRGLGRRACAPKVLIIPRTPPNERYSFGSDGFILSARLLRAVR